MKFWVFTLVAAVWWIQSPETVQNLPSVNQPEAVLTKLFPPIYPPLARQARISGDVKVVVLVRPDGTVASAEVLSGHPMLKPAAVDNAQKSEFECKGCSGETKYLLTYTFGLIEDMKPYEKFEDRPVRAARCIYLWKCGMVRVNTLDGCAYHAPEITHSPGEVRILAFPACINTESSSAALR